MAQNQIQITQFLRLIDVLEAENVSPSTSKILTKKYRYCVGLTSSAQFFECLFQYGIVMNLMLHEEYQTLSALLNQFTQIGNLIQNFEAKFSKCIRHLKLSPDADQKALRIRIKAIKYEPLVSEMFRTFSVEILRQNKDDGMIQQFGLCKQQHLSIESAQLKDVGMLFSAKNQREFQNLFKFFPEMFSLNFQAFIYDQGSKTLSKLNRESPGSKMSCSFLNIGSRYFLLYSKPQFFIQTADYSSQVKIISLKLPSLSQFFEEEKREYNESLQYSVRPSREVSNRLPFPKLQKDIEGIYEQLKLLNNKVECKCGKNQEEIKNLEVKIEKLEQEVEERDQALSSREQEQGNLLKLCIGMGVEIVKVLHKKSKPSNLVKHFEQVAGLVEEPELAEFINKNLIKRVENLNKVRMSFSNGSKAKKQMSFQQREMKKFQEDDGLEDIRRERAATRVVKEQQQAEKFDRIFKSKVESVKNVSSSFSGKEEVKEFMESKQSIKGFSSQLEDQQKFNNDSLESNGNQSQRRKELLAKQNQIRKEILEKKSTDSLEKVSSDSSDDIKEAKFKKAPSKVQPKKLKSSTSDSLEDQQEDSLNKGLRKSEDSLDQQVAKPQKQIKKIASSSDDSLEQ